MIDRRGFIANAASSIGLLALSGIPWRLRAAGVGFKPEMVIRKNAGCMCCDRWATHLNEHGIHTVIEEHPDLVSFKETMEVPEDLRSCHTGVIEGYVVEGHVPADDVLRLLEQRPPVRGIAVPGMPIGSPGMESGDRVDPYEVIAFGGSGEPYVFAGHGSS